MIGRVADLLHVLRRLWFCLCLSVTKITQKVVDKLWWFFWRGGACD